MEYKTDVFDNYYNHRLPPIPINRETVYCFAGAHLKTNPEIEVMAKRDYTRFPHWIDGDGNWYLEISKEGNVTVICDEAQVEAARVALNGDSRDA